MLLGMRPRVDTVYPFCLAQSRIARTWWVYRGGVRGGPTRRRGKVFGHTWLRRPGYRLGTAGQAGVELAGGSPETDRPADPLEHEDGPDIVLKIPGRSPGYVAAASFRLSALGNNCRWVNHPAVARTAQTTVLVTC